MSDKPLLYTIPEAATMLRVSRQTIYRMTERGEIPTIRIGRAVRISAAVLDAWVAAQSGNSSGAGPEPTPLRRNGRAA